MTVPDYFGVADSVRQLTPPAGLEAVHQDGFSWARQGVDWTSTTRLSPAEWNGLIAQFRGLLTIPGVDLSDLPVGSPMTLKEALLRAVEAAAVQGDPGPQGPAGAQGPQGPAGATTTDASLLTAGTLADARLSFTVSAFAKTLLDDADAAAFRTTASLYSQAEQDGRYAQLAAGNVFTNYLVASGGFYIDGTVPAIRFRDVAGNLQAYIYANAADGGFYLYGQSGYVANGSYLYHSSYGTFAIGGGPQAGSLITTGNIGSYTQTNEGLAHDAIGQYCFAATSATNTAITPGSTYAGSSLRAAGYNALDNITQPRMEKSATALTGTWKALSYAPATVSYYSVGMFVKIA